MNPDLDFLKVIRTTKWISGGLARFSEPCSIPYRRPRSNRLQGVQNLMARKKTPAETKVESIRHKDKRTEKSKGSGLIGEIKAVRTY